MKLKKLLTLTLALVMVLGTMGMVAFAEDATATALDQFTYTQDDIAKTVTLTKYNGSATEVVVPGTYDIEVTGGEGNTTTEPYAVIIDSLTTFMGNTSITSVTLGSGVAFKDDTMKSLFENCSALTSVDLTQISTTGITDMSYLFSECSVLPSVNLSSFDTSAVTDMSYLFNKCQTLGEIIGYEEFDTSNVTTLDHTFSRVNFKYETTDMKIDLSKWDLSNLEICNSCFNRCYAIEIKLPEEKLPKMGPYFFDHVSKITGTTYTIPAGVKEIGYAHTFYNMGTNEFVAFEVAEGNTNFKTVDGVLYSADGTKLLGMPKGKTFENNTYYVEEGVTFIAELAFSTNKNFNTLVLPDSYVFRQYVPEHDPEYRIDESGDNGNGFTNSITITLYKDTDVTDYAVKDTNPNYTSQNGIIYDKDMTTLLALPVKYDKLIDIPEGVTTWSDYAAWALSVDAYKLMVRSPGVNIPASMTSIAQNEIDMLNKIEALNGTKKALTSNDTTQTPPVAVSTTYTYDFKINVAEGNPVYRVNADGQLEAYVTAKIGDVYYATLAEAVTAANEMKGNVTIELLQDTTFTEMMTIAAGTNLTIDGGAFTITPGKVTVETDDGAGGTITSEEWYTGNLFTVEQGASLNLNNLTIDGNNNWTFDEETYRENFFNGTNSLNDYYLCVPEEDAPIATENLININGALTLNNTIIQNRVDTKEAEAHVLYATSGSSVTLNNGATITHCAAQYVHPDKNNDLVSDGKIIVADNADIIMNEGAEISDNLAGENGGIVTVGSGSIMTMNGGRIIDNYGLSQGIIMTNGSNASGDVSTFIMNDGLVSGNSTRTMTFYLSTNTSFIMYGGEIINNETTRRSAVCANQKGSNITVYGGTIADNTTLDVDGYSPDISYAGKTTSVGFATLYGGEYKVNKVRPTDNIILRDIYLDDICAPGYTAYECEDGLFRVIKLANIEFEDVTPDGTEGEKLYNINLIASEGDVINRLNSVDLDFAFDKDSDMAYEIIQSNSEIEINNVEGDRYEFHYKDKEDDVTSDTGAKITIGQVKFTGFGKFTFGVDETADTNAAHATELEDNIVDSFIASGKVSEDAIAGKSYLDISNKIEDEILVPLKNLKVNITFPNKVEYNAAAYQDMKLTVTGGLVNKTIALGDAAVDETTDDLVANPAVVTLTDNFFENGYSVSLNLPYNTTYTVAVEGAGYRTSRYSVTLSEDKVLNFWNNVKDNAAEIEEGLTSSAVKHNFVAGDIIDDNSINIYDLSAVISYFATENDKSAKSDYAKYDLNRDGVIDSKDVAYVLVSWGN